MSITDPIADMLTKIRNASGARQAHVDLVGSQFKAAIAEVLKREGFIRAYKWLESEAQPGPARKGERWLRVYLKFSGRRNPVIGDIMRVSKAGRRRYVNVQRLPRVMSGLGVAILSTSRGLMTDREARQARVGGEVICYVS